MRKNAFPGDVDLRGFNWSLAAVEPAWEAAAQRALAELADREREHMAGCAKRELMRGQFDQQLKALAHPGAIDPLRQRHSLLYLAQALERLREHQRVVEACAVAVDEARRERTAAHQRLDSLLRLQHAAVALYAAQERRRAGKEADQAWLAAFTRTRSQRPGGVHA